MGKERYLGMRPGDLDGKPYAKYWQPRMAPLQQHVTDALAHGEEARELAFGLEDAEQLLKPEYLPLENGFTTLDNGQIFVAVRTDMPNVTGEMLEWWMGCHTMEHQRYKLGHPWAHVANGTQEMQGDNPNLSDKEKYLTTHYVTEYTANRLEDITITFSDPTEYFGTDADWTTGGTTALLCGRVDVQWAPITIGYLIHQLRQNGDRSELRSRFWLGRPQIRGTKPGNPLNCIVGSKLVRRLTVPADLGRSMVEMNHLASFLPDLHANCHPDHKNHPVGCDEKKQK